MFAKDGPTCFELIHQSLCSTQRGYDLLAPKFDATPFRTPDEMIAPAVRVIGEVDAVLDVCCGTGAGMRLLRPICREKVVGIDFSSGMIEQARQKLARAEGAARVEFVHADVMKMTFRDEFDVVTCFGALGHVLPEQETDFMCRIHRALKPGGRFIFYSCYSPPWFSMSGLLLRSFNAVMKVRNALVQPPFIMYYLTFLLPQIVAKLEQEGFGVHVRAAAFQKYCLVIATKS